MHWTILIAASLFEALIPFLVIRSENYTHLFYTPALIVTVLCSILGLRRAMAVIPLGIAYLVWTSLGILGTVAIGATILGEQIGMVKLISLLVILVSVSGLRISDKAASS